MFLGVLQKHLVRWGDPGLCWENCGVCAVCGSERYHSRASLVVLSAAFLFLSHTPQSFYSQQENNRVGEPLNLSSRGFVPGGGGGDGQTTEGVGGKVDGDTYRARESPTAASHRQKFKKRALEGK